MMEKRLTESKQVWAREMLKFRPGSMLGNQDGDHSLDYFAESASNGLKSQHDRRAVQVKTLLPGTDQTSGGIFGANLELNR